MRVKTPSMFPKLFQWFTLSATCQHVNVFLKSLELNVCKEILIYPGSSEEQVYIKSFGLFLHFHTLCRPTSSLHYRCSQTSDTGQPLITGMMGILSNVAALAVLLQVSASSHSDFLPKPKNAVFRCWSLWWDGRLGFFSYNSFLFVLKCSTGNLITNAPETISPWAGLDFAQQIKWNIHFCWQYFCFV